MKSIALNKSIQNCVFYSVAGSITENSTILNRGVFDRLKDAKEEACKYAYAESGDTRTKTALGLKIN